MKKRVVTISREFGSGGSNVGRQVAHKLGFRFYDRAFVEKAAKESGFSKAFIEEQGEYAPGGTCFSYGLLGRDLNGMSMNDYLYQIQRETILEMAEQLPCVIVGRCSDYILADRMDCLHVYLFANKEFRTRRIAKIFEEPYVNAEKRRKDIIVSVNFYASR